MGKVLAIFVINEFPEVTTETIVGKEQVTVEGTMADAETRFYVPTEENERNDAEGYQKYVIKHSQKYSIEGKLWGREFNSILRTMRLAVYKKSDSTAKYAYSVGKIKGSFASSAMKRLKEKTSVKCVPFDVDLIDAIEKIVKSTSGIQINSGWFSNLGLPNLNNVLLQGDDVNRGTEWEKFKKAAGVELSNIELILEDDDFSEGQVKLALSKRGYVFSHSNIPDKKMLELTERIIEIIAPSPAIV